ncbi:major facilitator superfamily domain-containing protein [Kockovaella imperatae]|uniref:Major facilitator superfamily domain-containing protein n=1 Tax=Kockovaella imperatae TaxID=4999 RepID=A0A1Y1UNF2_9TREE|nr:major facilitator superfamily domain-containing protein [Kockovaella imperatae]ORX39588.1 major facilitator superfamily domain-containing protein [Kockovaella imperatae]
MSKLDEDNMSIHETDWSFKTQLVGWHATDEASFLRRMIPTWSSKSGSPDYGKNPLKALKSMSGQAWLMFIVGWFAWTCDGYDFFCVSLTLKLLSEQFQVDTKHITTAITLTLLFRSLGALIFGILGDRFGRKWTLVCNMILICVFELGSGFCNTYSQFLAVRSLFGIAMGGVWGLAASTALENVPVAARGLLSGIMQQGYSLGYLIAAAINIGVVPHSKYSWRSIFFVGAGFSLFAALLRALLPESESFKLAREEAKASGTSTREATKNFIREFKSMLRTNWLRSIWGLCLMAGLNFMAHATGDLYPLYLETTKSFTAHHASLATIIANVGAIVGGAVAGHCSQFIGRRLAIIACVCWAAAWIPLWILPSSFGGLAAGAFLVQSGVQGALGVIPIYLGEIAPPAFRATFAGMVYQLGNAASAGAAQIEADAGSTFRIIVKGKSIPDYATIMGLFLGVIIFWIICCILVGPEADGSHFEQARLGFQSGGGATTVRDCMKREEEIEQIEMAKSAHDEDYDGSRRV